MAIVTQLVVLFLILSSFILSIHCNPVFGDKMTVDVAVESGLKDGDSLAFTNRTDQPLQKIDNFSMSSNIKTNPQVYNSVGSCIIAIVILAVILLLGILLLKRLLACLRRFHLLAKLFTLLSCSKAGRLGMLALFASFDSLRDKIRRFIPFVVKTFPLTESQPNSNTPGKENENITTRSRNEQSDDSTNNFTWIDRRRSSIIKMEPETNPDCGREDEENKLQIAANPCQLPRKKILKQGSNMGTKAISKRRVHFAPPHALEAVLEFSVDD